MGYSMPTPRKVAQTIAMLGTLGFPTFLWGQTAYLTHGYLARFWWSQSWTLMALILFVAGVFIAQLNSRNWTIALGILVWGMASFWLFKTVDWWRVSGILYMFRPVPFPDHTQYKTVIISLLFPLVWGYLTPAKSLKNLVKRLINIIKWLRGPMF